MNLQDELKALKERIAELEELAKEEQEFPQQNDKYWYININGDVTSGKWEKFDIQEDMLEIGNVFETKEQAKFAVEKLKVDDELRKFSRPFKCGEINQYICFDTAIERVCVSSSSYSHSQGIIYFKSKDEAYQAIETVGEERIKKYIFGVEE